MQILRNKLAPGVIWRIHHRHSDMYSTVWEDGEFHTRRWNLVAHWSIWLPQSWRPRRSGFVPLNRFFSVQTNASHVVIDHGWRLGVAELLIFQWEVHISCRTSHFLQNVSFPALFYRIISFSKVMQTFIRIIIYNTNLLVVREHQLTNMNVVTRVLRELNAHALSTCVLLKRNIIIAIISRCPRGNFTLTVPSVHCKSRSSDIHVVSHSTQHTQFLHTAGIVLGTNNPTVSKKWLFPVALPDRAIHTYFKSEPYSTIGLSWLYALMHAAVDVILL